MSVRGLLSPLAEWPLTRKYESLSAQACSLEGSCATSISIVAAALGVLSPFDPPPIPPLGKTDDEAVEARPYCGEGWDDPYGVSGALGEGDWFSDFARKTQENDPFEVLSVSSPASTSWARGTRGKKRTRRYADPADPPKNLPADSRPMFSSPTPRSFSSLSLSLSFAADTLASPSRGS